MSGAINPEAAQPSSRQAFEQSDRNPPVTSWGGADAGGQVNAPAPSESPLTEPVQCLLRTRGERTPLATALTAFMGVTASMRTTAAREQRSGMAVRAQGEDEEVNDRGNFQQD